MATVTVIGTGNMGQAISGVASRGGNVVQMIGEGDNDKAATGDIVVLAVPYAALAGIVTARGDQLAGKVVVDITNPVDFETFDSLTVAADGSAAAEVAAALPALTRAEGVQHHLRRHAQRGHGRPADHHGPHRR